MDDEPAVLEGLKLTLRRRFALSVASSGAAGLEAIERDGPFAVVVSDMRMPGMDGATFLARVRERACETVRVLLTGQSDIESAILAINEGQIFRFLTKPCPPDALVAALTSAARQYELVTAERVLLEQTLRGSIRALTDVLSITNPTAFGRASQAKDHVEVLVAESGRPFDWRIEVAAMLSQLGWVTLPTETQERVYSGEPLSQEERGMVDRMPGVVEKLLAHIPRLETVREILAHLDDVYLPAASSKQPLREDAIPWGARALKIILDFCALESRVGNATIALATLRGRNGVYDPSLLDTFARLVGNASAELELREVTVRELREGMVLQADIFTRAGARLMSRGHEVTAGLLERVGNFARTAGVREPILVALNRVKLRPTAHR